MSYEQPGNGIRTRLLSGTLASALILGGGYVNDHPREVADAALDVLGNAYDIVADSDTPAELECPAPSKQALNAVIHMLTTPPDYNEVWDSTYERSDRTQDPMAIVGRHYGLTFQKTDDRPIYVEEDMPPNPLADAREAARSWGITVEPSKDPEKAPTEQELDSQATATILTDLAVDMRTQPKEYFQMANLGHVVLYSSDEIDNHGTITLGYVLPGSGDRTVYLNISETAAPLGAPKTGASVFNHEVGHLIDLASCGTSSAMDNDPAYFNITGNIYKAHASKAPNTQVAFEEKHSDAVSEIADEVRRQNPANDKPVMVDSCEADRRVEDQKRFVQAPDDYSLTNVVEHKASINGELANPNLYPELFDLKKPISLSAIHQAAQWYELNPKVITFNMAKRPETLC